MLSLPARQSSLPVILVEADQRGAIDAAHGDEDTVTIDRGGAIVAVTA